MPIKRLTVFAALVVVLLASGPLQAKDIPSQPRVNAASPSFSGSPLNVAPQLLHMLPIFNPVPMLTQSIVPSGADALKVASEITTAASAVEGNPQVKAEQAQELAVDQDVTDLRKALIGMAMKLRHIRYVRGGHDPSTGFDCSGFVRYVFAHAIGLNLPRNSAEQFLAGLKVKRVDMEPGDLVFFHTRGKHRISHVGIYISDGRFIHSPTKGKSVEISSLDESYWAKHFAGAKRPESIASTADKG